SSHAVHGAPPCLHSSPTRRSSDLAEVVAVLHVAPGQGVADIGSGSGYFTMPFARAVGVKGKVYAVDIEPGMVEHVRTRAKDEKRSEEHTSALQSRVDLVCRLLLET